MTPPTWFRTTVAALVTAGFGYLVFANIDIQSDLSFFQPRAPSRVAQLAIEQVRTGPASRLILIGLVNAPSPELARLSRAFVDALSASDRFSRVANGVVALDETAFQFLFDQRYLLGPPISSDAFSSERLSSSIVSSLQRLGSLSGVVMGDYLPADPTGRLVELLDAWQGSNQPHYKHGVWFSRDESTALVLVATVAEGDDFDGQAQAQAEIETTFSHAVGTGVAELKMTGPPVFSLQVSQSIRNEAWWIGIGSIAAVGLMLIGTFRSVRVLLIITLPTTVAAMAGAVAVQLLFGSVHGIALTFGAVLVGVTSDYPVHLISHLPGSTTPWTAVRNIAAPFGLGATTTAAAFLPMTLSSFPGLSQLGVFAGVGIATAALFTAFVMPWLLETQKPRVVAGSAHRLLALFGWARFPLLALGIVGALWLSFGEAAIFSDDLSRLSPLPRHLVELDKRLRADLGAPDVRRLVVIGGGSAEEVLVKSEEVAGALDSLTSEGAIDSYDAPSRYLPSAEAQRRRQTLLPAEADLRRNLEGAVQGLPVQSGTFEPFIRDVAAAKSRAPLEPADVLPLPLLGDRLSSLLSSRADGSWEAFILLSGVNNPDRLTTLLGNYGDRGIHYLDVQAESIKMIASYRAEALRWLAGGLAVVVAVLLVVLRFARAVRVLMALAVSISMTTAILVAQSMSLTPFHLVSLLLVAGMGLDYALFMSRDNVDAEDLHLTLRSVVICAVTTIAAFALMVLSSAPILRGIGLTVAIGVTLSLLCALSICRTQVGSLTAWSRWQ